MLVVIGVSYKINMKLLVVFLIGYSGMGDVYLEELGIWWVWE